jgi:DCN1-like protein 1/2
MQELIAQFCGITGAPPDQARRFLDKHKRLDAAVDAYYSAPAPAPTKSAGPSTAKITALFERYKAADGDADADVIAFDGTQALCDDLGVAPDDVVLLVLAFELGSPRLGEWPRKGWLDGWRALGCAPPALLHVLLILMGQGRVDTPEALAARLPALRARLRSEPAYFAKVYQHTFDFARAEGQRSLRAPPLPSCRTLPMADGAQRWTRPRRSGRC